MAWNTLPLAIVERMRLTPAITSKVGKRIHYQHIPGEPAYPHIFFTRSNIEIDELLDDLGPQVDSYSIEIVTERFDAALVDAVVEVFRNLDGPLGTGQIFVTTITDADDDYVFRSANSDALCMHALRATVHHDNEF